MGAPRQRLLLRVVTSIWSTIEVGGHATPSYSVKVTDATPMNGVRREYLDFIECLIFRHFSCHYLAHQICIKAFALVFISFDKGSNTRVLHDNRSFGRKTSVHVGDLSGYISCIVLVIKLHITVFKLTSNRSSAAWRECF